MNVVVTGGSGQLGTLVLRRLLANRKNRRIVCLDLRPPLLPLGRLEHIRCDIRDPDIGRHFAGADAVVHLAFVVTALLPRSEFEDINVGGTQNVIRTALGAGVRQIVYSSSVAAYGVVPGHPVPIVETSPRLPDPHFAYAAAKQAVEQFLDELEPQHPEAAISRLRPGILLGSHIEHALGGLLRAGFVPGGAAPMPLVWDEDVADAVLLALTGKARGAYNLVADDSLEPDALARATGFRRLPLPRALVRGLAVASAAIQRARKRPAIDPAWADAGAGTHLVFSSEKARTELGWSPRCATATAVLRHFREVAPRRLDPRLRLFFAALALGSRRDVPEEHQRLAARVHLALTGPRGGDLGLILDDGRLRVESSPPRPPTSVVRLDVPTLRGLLAGDLDFGTVQLTGRIEVQGEPSGALLLSAIVSTFRARRALPGRDGFIARTLGAWLKEAA
jgi:UDP-glucose 4-epimerase